MIIYYNSKELTKIFNLITLKFNNDIQFIYDIEIENNKIDYWIQYNNINTNCLNIIDDKNDKNDYSPNILNLYNYYYILECDISTISVKYENLVYLSYVIYNFIIINTNFQTNKPIVLDPISTMIYLYNNKQSFSRYGDGEILFMQDIHINYASTVNKYISTDILKNVLLSNINNKNILSGICDSFYDEYYESCFHKKNQFSINNAEYMCRKSYEDFVNHTTIYGSCFIGRVYGYTVINETKYLQMFNNMHIKNINIIIVCNKNDLNYFLDNIYWNYLNMRVILCPDLINCDIEFDIDKYVKNIVMIANIDSSYKILLHFGIYSKYISYILSNENISFIDLGSFRFKSLVFDKNHYYNINNVLSSINYYIFHNNVIGYDIVKISTDILDESDPVIINIKEIISLNDILEPNIQSFGIRFNQISLSKNYLNTIIKGKLTVKSNIPLKLFNGKNWLHINIDSYENDFDIYNINKWRISPSNEYLNDNIGKNNIEFIIYHIGFKIYEII
jgi:hypothetical protein